MPTAVSMFGAIIVRLFIRRPIAKLPPTIAMIEPKTTTSGTTTPAMLRKTAKRVSTITRNISGMYLESSIPTVSKLRSKIGVPPMRYSKSERGCGRKSLGAGSPVCTST